MIEVKEKIAKSLQTIVKDMGVELESVVVQEPTDITHGDLSSNIAMQLSKSLKSNPMDIASKIVSIFPKDEDIERVEVVKPGFINFFFSDTYLLNMLESINTKKDNYFKLDIKSGKRYVIEYTDPNPFKTLHIGHLYSNMVGESFSRLVEALGACVTRANYQGDVGLHVAKTMWGLFKMFENDGITFEELSKKSLVDRVRYLGDAYMLGFKMYDDQKDERVINDVKDINYYIFSLYIPSLEKREYFKDLESKNLKEIYLKGRDWCLEYFERIYERTDTKFEKYYLESEMGEKGMEIVKENMDGKGKNIFKASEGAVVYEGDESKGLHTRVFINSEGLPTYEAKELALAFKKFEELSFDESVVITADEQSSYFKVVLDALSQLRPEVANIYKHFSHGLVRLPGAEKMSSRKGKILEGEWLLDETKKRVEDMMRSNGKWNEEQILEVSDLIAVASVKYSFLKVTVGKDVIFDFEKSTSFDGDTGPYLLYVYARCSSILEGGKDKGTTKTIPVLDSHTKGLLRVISRYQPILLSSALTYSPSTLCSYLFDLGQTFNTFYTNVRVLDSEDKEFLLGVVEATSQTMKHGLNTLGINVVERM